MSITLREEQIVSALHDFVRDCDADELAWLVGVCFGGFCWFDGAIMEESRFLEDGTYEFAPNKDYMGAFDSLIKKEEEQTSEKN